jgi:hypothetical protein
MPDQIIDAAMALSLQADACRAHPLVGWLVTKDLPDYPGKVVGRLVTDAPSPYILVADTLAEGSIRMSGVLTARISARRLGLAGVRAADPRDPYALLSRLAPHAGGTGRQCYVGQNDPRRYRNGAISTNHAIRAKNFDRRSG